ncbi:MAG: hypothetical protein Q8K58_00885 [Acidimicrobiales bacterium]|nr:hypothetical protein [Acidimicrobiales bacterium]
MHTGRAVVAALLVAIGARVGVAPAERCPQVSPQAAEAAIAEGVRWLADGQRSSGRYTYLRTDSGEDLGGYNVVRHGGVQLALEQAAARGSELAEETAERGRDWALGRLVPAGGGRALPELDGTARTGASALFARSLLERRAATGTEEHDDVLGDLGRFLRSQVDEVGGVSSVWDPTTQAPVPGAHDKFFTGQVLWALDGLADVGLDEGETDALERVGRYLPRRDELEDFFPPVSDHWGAYAYDGLGLDRLTAIQEAHARRVADLIGMQVRGESTRWKGGLVSVIRGGQASGSGVGTLGEGGSALLRLFGPDELPGMTERIRCNAGMLVERQADDGAWYHAGATRMDDQQHSISALIAALPVLDAGADAVGGGAESHSWLWLLAAVLVVANPFRPVRPARTVSVAMGAAATVLVVLSGPILDALDVSPASARAAAGAALALAALSTLAAPASSGTAGVVAASAALVALALGADDGGSALLVVAGATSLALLLPKALRSATAARLVCVGALLLAADLLIDGILGV